LAYNNDMQAALDADPSLTAAQYRALLKVAEAVARHGELAGLFHDLVVCLPTVLPVDFLGVILHTDGKIQLHVLESRQPSRVQFGPAFGPDESPGGLVWQSQEPMLFADLAAETRFPRAAPIWHSAGMRAGCYVPLTTGQRRLGALLFARTEPNAYTDADLPFLCKVANQVAVAVDSALNFENARRLQERLAAERDRLRLLLDINNAIVTHLDLRELCRAVAASLRGVLQQQYTSLALFRPEQRQWELHALDFPGSKGLLREERLVPFDQAPASLAYLARKPAVLGPDELERFDGEIARDLLAEGIRNWCSVPLVVGGEVLGTLNVGRRESAAFGDADLELLSQVGGQVALAVANALAYRQIDALKDKLAEEKLYLEDEIRTEHRFAEIVGDSAVMRDVLKQVEVIAPSDSTVLIVGETGTGKELIARAIHRLSRRRERTFVKLNCAAIPTGLLESELFGHERGAFTGAITRKVGRFELAH
jgi:formate hydrogenlyase transcriptional activator